MIGHVHFLHQVVLIYLLDMEGIDPGRLAQNSPGSRIQVLDPLAVKKHQSAIGVVIGLASAYGLSGLISSQLYQVTPSDPMTFVLVAIVLSAVAMFASYIPARRATRVDPMVALRYE